MTTIAANRREMAADGCIHFEPGGSIVGTRRKILRIGETIVGTAGGVAEGNRFLEWFAHGGRAKKPRLSTEFSALVLAPAGVFVFDEECGHTEVECGYHAIGSGEQAARAMLSLGKPPAAAVHKAIELDLYSGPPVVVLRLRP